NGTFTGNTATNGAAIYNQGELTLVGGIIENNTAAEEGAIVVKGITDGAEGDARAKLTIDGVTFKGNVSEGGNAGEGGALTILRGADVEITGATVFEGNTAAVAGGAIATYGTKISGYNTLKVTGTEDTRILFKNNEGYNYGAVGLFSQADFTSVDFEDNRATATEAQGSDGGGAVLVGSASKTTFNDVDFDGNTSAAHGGALATRISLNASGTRNDHSGATLDIENAEFEENVATTKGGAIFNTFYNDKADSGSVNVTNVAFTENEATNGGAIYNDGNVDYKGNYASMTITNGTFTGNVAENKGVTLLSKGASEYTGQGGAIFNASDMTIVGGSFEQNEAVEGGAIFVAGQTKDATGDARAKLVIDGVSFVGNKTTGNDVGGAISVANGADVEILNGTVFDGNKSEAGSAGALYTYTANEAGTTYNTLKVLGGEDDADRVVFKNNEATGAGAVGVYAQADFEKVTFEKNKATTNEAGALSLGSRSTTTLTDVVFAQNTAAKEGGAIATRYSAKGAVTNNHSMATLDIENAEFSRNVSGTQGGAIFNTFYNDKAGSGSVNVTNVAFTENEANEGGAVYNDGNADKNGSYASLTITDGTFTGNKATTLGGAVYNAENATMTLAGTTTFTGNTVGGVANDIHNLGTLVISGATTIDVGITGTGDLTVSGTGSLDIGTTSVVQGTVTFESGSALVANLLNTTSYGSLTADTITATGADLKLTVGASGDYVVITGAGADTFNEASVEESSLFDLTTVYDETAKTLTLTATAKSGDYMATETGANQQSGSIMSGLASGVNDTASQILINVQNEGLTGKALDGALETLAPTSAPVTTSVASDVTGRISSIVGSQMSGTAFGRNGGDTEVDVDVWAKGLYSRAKQDASQSSAGFRGYTQGVAM
ncbi:MAG: hypothetical protein J6U64_04935, partial [Alphaproteobacteria bacterium]|nr:hypothetical protein [Alphaproteobacteria bacterium]